jgi:glycosyltransferase involved in cell wall biosynthesis
MGTNRLSRLQSEYPNVSVVLPTYRGDEPSELAEAIKSITTQTITPDEIFIVKDGELTDDLESVINEARGESSITVRTYQVEQNQGLGNALRVGVENCSCDLVARMDADDLSVQSRFERQLSFLVENPDVDIVGGYIQEFSTNPDSPISRREVPTTHTEIEQMARFRSPMNHGTVIFRKESVLAAGNYRPVDRMEDYDLWIRMLLQGATFANIPEVLVKVRAGEEMYGRRGGWEYAREEIRTQREFHERGFISTPIFIFNLLTRVPLRLIPAWARGLVYKLIARE